MVCVKHVGPWRRVRVAEARRGESLEQGPCCPRFARRLQGGPVRLGLLVARDERPQRQGEQLEDDEDEERERHGLGMREAAAAAREQRDESGGWKEEQSQPADAAEQVAVGDMAELV